MSGEPTIDVVVHVPARAWWRLAAVADDMGITVAELLLRGRMAKLNAEPVRRGTPKGRRPGVTAVRVAELHTAGLTDRQIAERLACRVTNVQYHRKRLDLAPNRGR